MSTRIPLRNLFVVLLAATGLSIVSAGIANASPNNPADPGLTCRYGTTVYNDDSVIQFNDGSFRCDNGHWTSLSGSNIDNRFG